MTRTFALCHGAGLDYCASCQRWAENQPEASKDSHQSWIPEATSSHCAYYMGAIALIITGNEGWGLLFALAWWIR